MVDAFLTGLRNIGAVTEQPPARPRTWRTAAIAVAIAVLAAAGVVAYLATRPSGANDKTPGTQTMKIAGYLTLERGQFTWDRTPTPHCAGYRGYSDLTVGTQVVVTDPSGATIALTQLPVGEPTPDPADNTRAIRCVFRFEVNAPAGHQFYGIEVARRGRVQYTPAQLAGPVSLSIG